MGLGGRRGSDVDGLSQDCGPCPPGRPTHGTFHRTQVHCVAAGQSVRMGSGVYAALCLWVGQPAPGLRKASDSGLGSGPQTWREGTPAAPGPSTCELRWFHTSASLSLTSISLEPPVALPVPMSHLGHPSTTAPAGVWLWEYNPSRRAMTHTPTPQWKKVLGAGTMCRFLSLRPRHRHRV